LQGPGRDGLSEAENEVIYDDSAGRFRRFCREAGITPSYLTYDDIAPDVPQARVQ
jgi:hypothetical protein